MTDARTYLSARIAKASPERVAIRDILDTVPTTRAIATASVRATIPRRREALAAEARP